MGRGAGRAGMRRRLVVLVCLLVAAATTGTDAARAGPRPSAGGAPDVAPAASAVLFDPAWAVPDTVGASPKNVATGDLNGDGLTDMTLALGEAWAILYQLPDGRTGPPVVVDATAGRSSFPQVADLDGDGRLDLALFRDTSSTSGTMTIYRQDQAGALAFARAVATPSIRWVATGDVTGDGRADIVIHGADAPFSPGIFSLAQLAGGAFGAAVRISSNGVARWLRVVDLDGDQRADLVYHASSTAWKVRYQDLDHHFATEVTVATTLPDMTEYFGEVADLNGDGRRDLAVSAPSAIATGIAIAYQDPDGTFAAAHTREAPGAGKLQVGDVDGDGKTDLVARVPAGLAVYRQDASGVPPNAELWSLPILDAYVLDDVNGDGMEDVVSTTDALHIAFGAIHNRGPTAQDPQKVTTTEGVAVDIDLMVADPDGDPLRYVMATAPAHGTVSGAVQPNRFTPAPGFYGTDAYAFRVSDGKRKFATGKVEVEVVGLADLQGTIDDGYGLKLRGIEVTAHRWVNGNWQLAGSTATDENGEYSLSVPAGDLSLYFDDPSGAYAPEWYDDASSSFRTPITAEVHQVTVADAALPQIDRLGRPIVVTSTADGGPGSLRQAVAWANASVGNDIIALELGQVYELTCAAGGELESKHGHLEIQAQGSTIRQTCPGHRVINQSEHSGGEANLVIRNAVIEGGSSTGCGGGLFAWYLAVYDSTVRDNSSDVDGGGVCGHMLIVERSTIHANHAGGAGGGVSASRLWLRSSTVDHNEAAGTGGGIALSTGQSFLDELFSSTITDNRGTPVANLSGDPQWGVARGTVISGAAPGANCTSLAHMTSQGYNYVDDATCALGHATDVVGGSDPGLAPLADNGGPVWTRQPLVGSPLRDAIPAGASFCTGYDARGGARPFGAGCDIGAVEAGATPAVAPGAPSGVTATAQVEQAAVTWSAPTAVPGGLTGYTVTSSPGGRTCAVDVVTGSEPLTCIVYGLEGGISYTFTVRAIGRGGPGPASAPSAAVRPPGAATLYHPMAPVRKMDTRVARPGAPSAPVQAGTPVSLSLGLGPSVKAAVMNVTVTQATHGSFLTVFAGDTAAPAASSINFGAGETIANQLTVPVHNGKVTFANAVGSVHVITDVVGTYSPPSMEGTGDRFTSLTPTRLLDSRTSVGGWSAPLLAGDANTRTLVIAQQGVPSDATAVVLNVTTTAGSAGSFLHVFPSGSPRGPGSNLNFAPGQTIANQVTVQTGTNGQISFFNAVGAVQVIVDVVGYYRRGTGQLFHVVAATRLIDDRVGAGASGPWGAGQTREVTIAGVADIPADAAVVVANLTATNATAGSYVVAHPAATGTPTASTLNFGPGQTIANGTTTRLGTGPAIGAIALYNHRGAVDLIADVAGYFSTR